MYEIQIKFKLKPQFYYENERKQIMGHVAENDWVKNVRILIGSRYHVRNMPWGKKKKKKTLKIDWFRVAAKFGIWKWLRMHGFETETVRKRYYLLCFFFHFKKENA